MQYIGGDPGNPSNWKELKEYPSYYQKDFLPLIGIAVLLCLVLLVVWLMTKPLFWILLFAVAMISSFIGALACMIHANVLGGIALVVLGCLCWAGMHVAAGATNI